MAHPIILYDGVCGLCNRLVQFVLRRDRRGVFRFAALQSGLAARVLARHGMDARRLAAVCVVVDLDGPEERLLVRSDAVDFVLRELGGGWGVLGRVLQIVPRALRGWGYGVVARYRYGVFGKYEVCAVPREEDRGRFLDL
jgi:predicted DCC family thiol-disulfide oxidoreductase YuxK